MMTTTISWGWEVPHLRNAYLPLLLVWNYEVPGPYVIDANIESMFEENLNMALINLSINITSMDWKLNRRSTDPTRATTIGVLK